MRASLLRLSRLEVLFHRGKNLARDVDCLAGIQNAVADNQVIALLLSVVLNFFQ